MTLPRLTRLTPLDGESILPLPDAKTHLKVDTGTEDGVIRFMRGEALKHVEETTGWALTEGSFRWTTSGFGEGIVLPVRPATAITEMTYLDASGVAQVYAGARLVGDAIRPAEGEMWPYARGFVSVVFTAGPPPEDKLSSLQMAALVRLEVLYDRGGTPVEVMKARANMVRSMINGNGVWQV